MSELDDVIRGLDEEGKKALCRFLLRQGYGPDKALGLADLNRAGRERLSRRLLLNGYGPHDRVDTARREVAVEGLRELEDMFVRSGFTHVQLVQRQVRLSDPYRYMPADEFGFVSSIAPTVDATFAVIAADRRIGIF